MNGYDLLLIGFGFFLVWLIVKYVVAYIKWSNWDQHRRRERMRYRISELENDQEKTYRKNIRLLYNIFVLKDTIAKVDTSFARARDAVSKMTQHMNALAGKK